jgi:hypothetical protein
LDIINKSARLRSNADRGSANKTFNNQAKNKHCIYCKNKGRSSLGHLEDNCYYKYFELVSDRWNSSNNNLNNKGKNNKKSSKNNNKQHKNKSTKAIMC